MDPYVLALWAVAIACAAISIGVYRMSIATERLDASIARIAKDVSDAVGSIRANANNTDTAQVLADCDKLDALSEALEGVANHVSGTDAGGTEVPAPTESDQPDQPDQPQG